MRTTFFGRAGRFRHGLGVLTALGLMLPVTAPAQVVELNPVEVTGTVQIGDLIINSLTVRLSSSVGSATRVVPVAPDTNAATWSTIVQVPVGGTAFYRLHVQANLRTADGSQFYSFRADVPGSHALVDPGPNTIDLILDPPPILRYVVTAQPGERIDRVSLIASRQMAGSFGEYITSASAPAGGVEALTVDVPVLAGLALNCGGSATMTTGRAAAFIPIASVTVPAGGVGVCEVSPQEPPPTGGIQGHIDYFGDVAVDEYLISANRLGGGGGPPDLILEPPFAGPGNRAEYAFTDVPLGQYGVDSRVTLRGGQDLVFLDVEESVGVSEGIPTIVGADICQARIVASFAFGGLTPLEDYVFGDRPFLAGRLGFGVTESSQPLADPSDGNPVEFLVRNGRYELRSTFDIRRDRFAPGGYTNSDVTSLRFFPDFDVACGETVTAPAELLETGRVEVRFRVADGRPLSNPLLDGSCESRDEDTGEVLYTFNVDANSALPGANTIEGVVPVEAPAAVCDFTARATVSGVNLSFGNLNDVEIVAGATSVIDLDGPRVEITSPVPGALVDAGDLLVTGTATDESEVVSVVVNGVAADLVPSGNPSDPQEVVFTATVPLAAGETRITAAATDDDGNESEVSLDVVNATSPDLPPSIEITVPASGATLETETVRVQGTATDDGEIVDVVVNGVVAALASTGNPDDPAEVAFEVEIPLVFGNNVIVAVVRDDAGNETEARRGILHLPPPSSTPCDVDENGVIDMTDVLAIFAARGSEASGPDDPRDSNGDGIISINDGRLCVLQCTNLRCAP